MAMITAIIIIGIALSWLGYETDWMAVRLPYGKPSTSKVLLLSAPTTKPVLLLDTIHYKPSEFELLDMPETTGSLNIICKRG